MSDAEADEFVLFCGANDSGAGEGASLKSQSPALFMIQYLELLRHVLENGKLKPDRTGTGTYSLFGAQARFDLRNNFPVLTTKKLHLRSIIYELLWFLRGERNVRYLQ